MIRIESDVVYPEVLNIFHVLSANTLLVGFYVITETAFNRELNDISFQNRYNTNRIGVGFRPYRSGYPGQQSLGVTCE